MILSALLGNKVSELGRISMIMVILGVLSWPGLARLVRGQILAEREKEFGHRRQSHGHPGADIIFRHIIPNVLTVVIVNATLNFASALLTESALSFLGFGVVEPNPTLGQHAHRFSVVHRHIGLLVALGIPVHRTELCHHQHQPDRRRPAGRHRPQIRRTLNPWERRNTNGTVKAHRPAHLF